MITLDSVGTTHSRGAAAVERDAESRAAVGGRAAAQN